MTLMTSWTKARRAHEARAFVRELLWKREPAFAAELATAEQDFPCPSLSRGNTMSTVVTGASGHPGRLVIGQPLATGTPPTQIVATGRDVNKLNDLAQDGVTVRRADFADPSTLQDALAGADAMPLVSTTTVGS